MIFIDWIPQTIDPRVRMSMRRVIFLVTEMILRAGDVGDSIGDSRTTPKVFLLGIPDHLLISGLENVQGRERPQQHS